jgi:hypothetical protein
MGYNCLFTDVDVTVFRRNDDSLAFKGVLDGQLYLVGFTDNNAEFTTGKHLIPVGLKPTGIILKPTGISNSRRFRAYSRRFQPDGRPLSGIRLSPSAADGNN